LLLISLDNIPMILNWQGDEVVDKVCDDLVKKLKASLPNNSIIKRISTDQFGLVIKNPVANEVNNITNEINRLVNLYKSPNFEDAIHLSLSIGSASFPLGIKDEFDAINKAYLALLNAKSKDYEFYCDFEDAKREHIDAQNEMSQLHYLQEAYNEDRLVLAYQPIICTETGEVSSYESLLRIDEGNYYTSAGRFIPIAEKMGTVDVIDEFVLHKVVKELKENPEIRIGMNVSSMTTGNDNWLKMCSKVLVDEDIASRIYVEITETAVQKDLRKTAYFTASLQAMGCSVALDDFGVGYTSFRQLRSLSVDTVKIDGSYILGIEENKENMVFIRSLVDFNKSYGLKTVAECVENGEVAKMLMRVGVDYLQGYYFGKPEVGKPWLKGGSTDKSVIGQSKTTKRFVTKEQLAASTS
jgi:EAL domain-containing protein (putative c-di-GMP-specific phosphodiesterase class I)/GGDEF domain-containing protein